MTHATELIEALTRDFTIALRGLSPSLTKNVESILGPRATWDLEPGNLSEHALLRDFALQQVDAANPTRLRSLQGTWTAIRSIDKLRAKFAPVPVLNERPCSVRQPGRKAFKEEAWFFVNGIACDKEMLQLNGECLVKLFHRPIELIYNPTQGPLADLIECILGRTFDFVSKPATYALERVSAALCAAEKRKVILLGHSQGGIIVANVVAALVERFGGDADLLHKLEVYTFASACDHMQVDPQLDMSHRRVPYIEHFANTGDMVAQLGVLHEPLPIAGKVYTIDKPGHLLNAHYLSEFEHAPPRYRWTDSPKNQHHEARLFGYRWGHSPTPLPKINNTDHDQAAGQVSDTASNGSPKTRTHSVTPRIR